MNCFEQLTNILKLDIIDLYIDFFLFLSCSNVPTTHKLCKIGALGVDRHSINPLHTQVVNFGVGGLYELGYEVVKYRG